jgi:methylglutamate dehydrogenase subunit B
MRLHCPFCGPRASHEFAYAGDASTSRPDADAPLAEWTDFVFFRDNPAGEKDEYWQHVQGCRKVLIIRRDTRSHALISSAFASDRPQSA